MSSVRVGAIIPAAGKGTRIGGERRKQFLELGGKPLLLHVLEYIQMSRVFEIAILVAGKEDLPEVQQLVSRFHLTKVKAVVEGGNERQDSVWNGLQRLANENPEYVAVHDGVRPFLDDSLVDSVLKAAVTCGAAVPAVRPKETIKQANPDLYVATTPSRPELWLVQTPQIFKFPVLMRAFQSAMAKGFYGTDEASLVERIGEMVKIVPGNYDNIKITTPDDLELAEIIWNRRRRSAH